MTEKLREQISALVDDSLLEGEHALLVRRFGADRELRSCWERYHLIGEAMRKGLPEVDTRGFADRIMMILDGETVPDVVPRTRLLGLLGKAFAGMAVAASVAAVAVVGLRHDTSIGPQAPAAPSEIVPANPNLNATLASYTYSGASNATWNGAAPDVQAQLGNYLINHNETAASLPQPTVLPYFYVATYDPRVNAGRAGNGQTVPARNPRHPR